MMIEKTRVKRKKEKKVKTNNNNPVAGIPVKTLAVQSFASIF